jgi:hypothetical protein
VAIAEAVELCPREGKQTLAGRGIPAADVDASRGELNETLQEEFVVADALLPEELPLLVSLEEPAGPELFETLREGGCSFAREAGGSQAVSVSLRAAEARPSGGWGRPCGGR